MRTGIAFTFLRVQTISLAHTDTVYRGAGGFLLWPIAHRSLKSKGEAEYVDLKSCFSRSRHDFVEDWPLPNNSLEEWGVIIAYDHTQLRAHIR